MCCLFLIVYLHWTLLVLDRDVKEARYYDSLLKPKADNVVIADLFMGMLKKEAADDFSWLPDAVPQRRNSCRQGPLECGFYVCAWMEDEARHQLVRGGAVEAA